MSDDLHFTHIFVRRTRLPDVAGRLRWEFASESQTGQALIVNQKRFVPYDVTNRDPRMSLEPPAGLDFEKSLMFFHAYMYGPLQGKLRLYGARKIPQGSVAMSSDWEVFASMPVNDLGRKFGARIDLANYEVKSAKRGGSYECQYHNKTGLEKLSKDTEVGHLFFDYFNNPREVDLRYLHGSQLVPRPHENVLP